MKQWHPVFAQLLRPAVQDYYEVQTTVPVGDAPREADFVLLRRTAPQPPFRGLWRHLTTWNILEFKGPSVSPRRDDVELLVELGLGIVRRLRQNGSGLGRGPGEVSFWYLANRVGRRFLNGARQQLGVLEDIETGLWRSRVLGYLVFLVSSTDLPVEEESLPLHIVGREPVATERAVAQLVADQPRLQELYGGWVASLHPAAWTEVEAMARAAGKALKIDLRPAIDMLGLAQVIEQVGIDRVIDQIGIDRVIERVGEKEVINQIGLERWLANLTPAQRRELKRRLQ